MRVRSDPSFLRTAGVRPCCVHRGLHRLQTGAVRLGRVHPQRDAGHVRCDRRHLRTDVAHVHCRPDGDHGRRRLQTGAVRPGCVHPQSDGERVRYARRHLRTYGAHEHRRPGAEHAHCRLRIGAARLGCVHHQRDAEHVRYARRHLQSDAARVHRRPGAARDPRFLEAARRTAGSFAARRPIRRCPARSAGATRIPLAGKRSFSPWRTRASACRLASAGGPLAACRAGAFTPCSVEPGRRCRRPWSARTRRLTRRRASGTDRGAFGRSRPRVLGC